MIWPNQRLLDLFGIDLPIIQAPMAGLATSAMAAAVAEVGGLGSLGCAVLSADQIRAELSAIRRQTSKPINLNFFCHRSPATDPAREAAWRGRLKSYYVELGLDPEMPVSTLTFAPFGDAHCDLVAELKPKVVSFHFGLPNEDLLGRVKAAGATILSSATSVKEAIWLEQRGCDAIIAQGLEAGGHRGMFLSDNVATQAGTMALVPQVADAVGVPVIAAGGIAEERGIAAAFMLGASGVQMGTAYLFCPEANVSPLHRQALKTAQDDQTVLTNVLSGRAARAIVNRIVRELGPMAEHAPAFPLAGAALAPLRSRSEPSGSDDFTPLWSGQAARLGRELPAGELTVRLAKRALAKLGALQPAPDQPRKSPNRSAI
jgi:nitronate monooxygenase